MRRGSDSTRPWGHTGNGGIIAPVSTTQTVSQSSDAADRLPLVPFCPFRCPSCDAGKPATYGQKGRLRYHRCKDCGTRYRSLELRREQLHGWTCPT